jgi:ribosome biogenesis GTPase A
MLLPLPCLQWSRTPSVAEQVAGWVGPKPRLLVMNRQDQVSSSDRRSWAEHYRTTGQRVFWTQGKAGDGIPALKQVNY